MFQRNKNSYRIVAVCRNGVQEGRYTFIEGYDEDWFTIASRMFYVEFGINPIEGHLISRERL